MAFNLRVWSLGFTSIAIGALALLALCLVFSRGGRAFRLTLALTCLSAICALAVHGPFALFVLREAAGLDWPLELRWPIRALGESMVGLLWLSMLILFGDVRVTPLRLAPITALAATSLASALAGGNGGPFGWLAIAINLALAVHAFVHVAQGWAGDLVEGRRRLRRPLLVVLAATMLLVLIAESALFAGAAAVMNMDRLNAVLDIALVAITLVLGVLLLEPRAVLVEPPSPPPPKAVDRQGDDDALARLEELLTEREVWRREGLTVSALAGEVGLPEHRLRALINGRLGHRNFATLINTRRIAAARAQFADPAFADVPISKVAYDLGFGSLGPFNRAFKDATGATPTEWRRSRG